MAVKSTKTLAYALKGTLDKENMNITETSEEDVVVHDLEELLAYFDGKEIAFSISMKDKLENGVE